MDNKNLGIIITIVTILLCGLPGLVFICSGVILAFSKPIFDEPVIGLLFSFAPLCIGLIFLAIPIIAGFITFRNRPQIKTTIPTDEPIPPPS
jgi:hypothetical protein